MFHCEPVPDTLAVLLPPLRDIVALPVTASTPPQVCAAAGDSAPLTASATREAPHSPPRRTPLFDA